MKGGWGMCSRQRNPGVEPPWLFSRAGAEAASVVPAFTLCLPSTAKIRKGGVSLLCKGLSMASHAQVFSRSLHYFKIKWLQVLQESPICLPDIVLPLLSPHWWSGQTKLLSAFFTHPPRFPASSPFLCLECLLIPWVKIPPPFRCHLIHEVFPSKPITRNFSL